MFLSRLNSVILCNVRRTNALKSTFKMAHEKLYIRCFGLNSSLKEFNSNPICFGYGGSDIIRKVSTSSKNTCDKSANTGLVLGVYNCKTSQKLSPIGQAFDLTVCGELTKQLEKGPLIKPGTARIYYGLGDFTAVSVVGISTENDKNPCDMMDFAKEYRRAAAGIGAKALIDQQINVIEIDDMEDGHSAAEGAYLATHLFQPFKSKDKQKPLPEILLSSLSKDECKWKDGKIYAYAQNWARQLAEMPANLLTPEIFIQNVTEELSSLNICMEAHGLEWLEDMNMGSFLSVARGSENNPYLLELDWKGNKDSDDLICLVGKGITFDSGGISLKPPAKMGEMRADMTGAAIVCATIKAVAELKLPLNVKVLAALAENMPGPTATRPGDVVFARNGKSICVDNTDAEGRLVLADTLVYASEFDPDVIIDVATLTGAMTTAIGPVATGAFVNNKELWNRLECASYTTGDRVWRFPLYEYYKSLLQKNDAYDLNNIGPPVGGGSCTAAAFLSEFVSTGIPWAHLDMASVMNNTDDQKYLSKGMTARPIRTIIELIKQGIKND